MEYPDGSVAPGLFGPVTRVGWLTPEHPGARGDARQCLRTLLRCHDAQVVLQTRGYHQCLFCRDVGVQQYPSTYGDLHLGSAELVVQGPDKQLFAVPNLAIHYIDAHNYQPPQAFIDACAADLGPFGLTIPQIAEGIVAQDLATLIAVSFGANVTHDVADRVVQSLVGMLRLDTALPQPDFPTPDISQRPTHWAQVGDRGIAPQSAAHRWLTTALNTLDPDRRHDVLHRWLDETPSWSKSPDVFPVAATMPYGQSNDLTFWILTCQWPGLNIAGAAAAPTPP